MHDDSLRPFGRVLVMANGKVEEYVFCGNPMDRINKVTQEGRDEHDLRFGQRIMDWLTRNATSESKPAPSSPEAGIVEKSHN